jgi:transposase
MQKPMVLGTDIVYIDECGIDKFMARQYGRAKSGKRVVLPEHGRKFKRVNIVAAIINGLATAVRLYDWAMTATFFLLWFQYELCPNLRQKSIIIMDNASFHKKSKLEQIARLYKSTIVWLPPYSPDKNKIEKLWANLKNWLRINSHNFLTIQDAIKAYFQLK